MKAITRFVLQLGLFAGLVVSGFWIYQQHGAFAIVVSVGLLIFGLWTAIKDVDQRAAIILKDLSGRQRVITSGLNLTVPFFERVDVTVDVTPLEIYLEASPDTRKNNNITIKLVIGGMPSLRYLPRWVGYIEGGNHPKLAVQAWCEGMLTELVHYYSKRGEIYRDKRVIANLLVARYLTGAPDGGSLESRYGFDLQYINVKDIVMPGMLKEKELLKEAAVEEGKALAISVAKAIKETRKVCKNLSTISEKTALDFVMMDKGRPVTKIIKTYEASDLAKAAEEMMKSFRNS